MEVKYGAQAARAIVASLFADERISNILLEEVDFEELPEA